mmetsp:Transcript_6446/g.9059  ORF Transcript_6446/g.9059 Transcript_6446/m.9059 type:complete len:227 (-) Transcript_6446:884-1564(-)
MKKIKQPKILKSFFVHPIVIKKLLMNITINLCHHGLHFLLMIKLLKMRSVKPLRFVVFHLSLLLVLLNLMVQDQSSVKTVVHALVIINHSLKPGYHNHLLIFLLPLIAKNLILMKQHLFSFFLITSLTRRHNNMLFRLLKILLNAMPIILIFLFFSLLKMKVPQCVFDSFLRAPGMILSRPSLSNLIYLTMALSTCRPNSWLLIFLLIIFNRFLIILASATKLRDK